MLVRVCLLLAVLLTGAAQAQERISESELSALHAYKRALTLIIRQRLAARPRPLMEGGVVSLRIVVQRTGLVTQTDFVQRSRSERVDRIAFGAVAPGSRFPPFPPEMRQRSLAITFPITLRPDWNRRRPAAAIRTRYAEGAREGAVRARPRRSGLRATARLAFGRGPS